MIKVRTFLGAVLFAGCLFCTNAGAQTNNVTADVFFKSDTTAPEYRFLWVTRYQIQTTNDVTLIVERAKKYNYNALFVQVCALGEAYYHSRLMPWGKGVSENFDPLLEITKQAHAEGIEVHAWLNALFVWEQGRKFPTDPQHVLRRHPEWIIRDKRGKTVYDYAPWEFAWVGRSGVFLDPAIPEVQEHIVSLYREVAERYRVDGLHFDYIRYPGSDFGYSAAASTAFQQEFHADPIALVANKSVAISVYGEQRYNELIEAWRAFRRRQIEQIVEAVYASLPAIRKNILLSAAVVAELPYAKNDYFQDWEAWMHKGLIDMIVPMSYSQKTDVVKQQITLAATLAQTTSCKVIAGLGAWRQSPEELAGKVITVRELRDKGGYSSLIGVSLFSYDAMASKGDYFLKVRESLFSTPVRPPQWRVNVVANEE